MGAASKTGLATVLPTLACLLGAMVEAASPSDAFLTRSLLDGLLLTCLASSSTPKCIPK